MSFNGGNSGPLGCDTNQPVIDEGTLCQHQTPLPGPTGCVPASSRNGLVLLEYNNGPINLFSEQELNSVIKTVYGELTMPSHIDTFKEAKAIASTIFNRKKRILSAREDHKKYLADVEKKKSLRQAAEKNYNDIAKRPSQIKKELLMQGDRSSDVEDLYKKKLSATKLAYDNATKEFGAAQKAAVAAKTALDGVEQKTIPGDKVNKPINLIDIISQDSQYEGTKKGINDFKNFNSINDSAKREHYIRYSAAMRAVIGIAKNSDCADSYWEFKGGNLRPNGALAGETKIGKNYFK